MQTKRIIRNLLRSEISEGIKKDRDVRVFETRPPEVGFTEDTEQVDNTSNSEVIDNETNQEYVIEEPKPKREKVPREKVLRVKVPREKIPREKTPRIKKNENKGE